MYQQYLATTRPDLVAVKPRVSIATLWLAVHEELHRTPRVHAFVDHLVHVLDARRQWLLGVS